jgi:hypothetical protein
MAALFINSEGAAFLWEVPDPPPLVFIYQGRRFERLRAATKPVYVESKWTDGSPN